MADIPTCRNPHCPKSQTIILQETETNWQVGCLTCRSARVISKPDVIKAAKYTNMMQTKVRRATQREKKQFAFLKG